MKKINKKTVLKYLMSVVALLLTHAVWAGTPAGTTIVNQASITFSQGTVTGFVLRSNTASFVVNELIDVQVSWIDSSQIPVSTPDYKKVLTFKLTNIGNGKQQYTLSVNPNIGGGNFNPLPENPNVFIENNLQTSLQVSGPYADTIYSSGNTVSLGPNESKNIYLVYDIPANLPVSYKGFVQLEAVSTTSGVASATKAGTLVKNADGTDAIVGYTLGRSHATGNFIINSLQVTSNKSVIAVKDAAGGNVIESQSVLTYQILLDIEGTGKAKNIIMTDKLPAEEDYVPGTLMLNQKPLPDTGNVVGNNINVVVGDQLAPQKITLTFQAKIK